MRFDSARTFVMAGLVVIGLAGGASGEQSPPPMKPATLHELVLRDGSRMYGAVESETDTEIVFRTHVGASLTLRRADVVSLKKVSGTLRADEFLPPDPNATRLFFAPTGRSLKRGQTYVGVFEFLMPFVQVGVTDRISIGGGTPLLFGFGDESDRPFWLTPKVQIVDTDRTQLAAGMFHVFAGRDDGGGIAYTVLTHGTDVKSFTGGLGLSYANDGARAVVVMLGGEGRIGRGVKAITENYLWEGGKGIITGGFRFFGERVSADLALGVPIGVDGFVMFPVVNFVYVF